MNNAELYHRSNTVQKRDSLQCLEEYGKRIKWKTGRITVIDIGCGDGSVMIDILKKIIPNNCEKLVGCDKSEKMIKYANEHYANDHTSFMVLDIEGDLPNELRGNFDHAFSFFVLHWIQHQEMAFTNIYDLLKIEGECFLVFVAHTLLFEGYRILSRSTRWKFWLIDVERFISPYHDCQDPEKKVKQMMKSIGFTSVEVECLQKAFIFPDLDALKGFVTSINPFQIPKDLEEDYLLDLFNVLRDLRIIDCASSNVDGPIKATLNHSLIVAKGRK